LIKRWVLHFCLILLLNENAYSIALEKIKCVDTGKAPKSVAVSPDGKVTVVNNLEDGSIWLLDTSTKSVIKGIEFFKTRGIGFNYQTKTKIPSVQEKPVECAFSEGGGIFGSPFIMQAG
jgi:DNA-binding beta-propeller fold protein YncE